MENQTDPLHDRLRLLEAQVASLQARLDALEAPAVPLSASTGPESAERPIVSPSALASRRIVRPSRPKGRSATDVFGSVLSGGTEGLLNKVGIALLLLGLVFLFKYSVDRGWITESVRVLVGAVLGIGLIGIGFQVRSKRAILAPVLIGGGVAALYTTVYAAFQMYSIVPHPVAFASMAAITACAFLISVYHSEVWLALIAVVGGFATPFLLHTGAGSLAALVGYTCVVISGAAAIYAFNGWRSLLYTSALGALLVTLVTFTEVFDRFAPAMRDRVVMQLGVAFFWLAFALAPVVWEIVRRFEPSTRLSFRRIFSRPTFLFAFAVPLFAVVFSQHIWAVSAPWGWVAIGLSILYVFGSIALGGTGFSWLAESHRFAVALLVPLGLLYLLEGNWLLFALAGYSVALLGFTNVLGDAPLSDAIRVLLAVVGVFLAGGLIVGPTARYVFLDSGAVASLLAICILAVGPRLVTAGRHVGAFALGGHLLLLLWILQEIGSLPNGAAWATMVAAVYAMALLVVGLRLAVDSLRLTGLFTILGVVAKLLIFDLADLEALWRILLFLGFGGVLLILSYFVPSLWRRQTVAEKNPQDVVV